ncbi:hypothetical protein NEOLI_002109 [Neolecta irregularis DAH-3]|uniref:Uncharacterized protein n=1 Tax=Neolecta irregularis (strain DAH-3) TaxID=1198029 RepID=A0A1U7LU46_NEOID|nr:hypothetical protein NEOLI_002109 [Neolecta irregularis DAH-3]|eukprot:OLL26149.1 hypothetical protein NEOLI_002109 [Neolecta irregularis DAH-3]
MAYLESGISRRFRSPAIISFSLLLSAFLYAVAAPALRPLLGAIARPAAVVPWQMVVLLRTAEVYIISYTGQSLNEAALTAFLARVPILHLLNASFSIPAYALVLVSAIDVSSIFIPFWLIRHVRSQCPPQDKVFSGLYTALSATILSIAIYVGSKTWYPHLVLTHFDGIRSVVPIPLPLLVVGLLPAGWALQEIFTIRGSKGLASLLAQMIVVATGNIWLSVRGADLAGVIGISGAWAMQILITAAILKWVGV